MVVPLFGRTARRFCASGQLRGEHPLRQFPARLGGEDDPGYLWILPGGPPPGTDHSGYVGSGDPHPAHRLLGYYL